jgi:hypothetical protein
MQQPAAAEPAKSRKTKENRTANKENLESDIKPPSFPTKMPLNALFIFFV